MGVFFYVENSKNKMWISGYRLATVCDKKIKKPINKGFLATDWQPFFTSSQIHLVVKNTHFKQVFVVFRQLLNVMVPVRGAFKYISKYAMNKGVLICDM